MGVSSVLSDLAPWLVAGLTGGPIGLAAKAAGSLATALGLGSTDATSVTNTLETFIPNPAQQMALKQAELDFQFKMKAAGYADMEALAKTDLDQLAVVNATMVAELQNADKESWFQKNWRPMCGMSVAAGSFMTTAILGLLFWRALEGHDLAALNVIPQLALATATVLGVPGAAVGIIAWHAGKNDIATTAVSQQTSN